MNVFEVEELAALVENWREAKEARDSAASEAFENELHERVTPAEIRTLEAPDPNTGEPSATATDQLRSDLQEMWSKASARLW
jgi:hypothetical protein